MTLLPFTIIFFFFLTTTFSQTIPLNSTLSASTPNSRYNSPNSTFSLNFIQSPDTTSSLILAVVYNSIPIWSAPPLVNTSAILHFTPTGDLQLLATPSSTTPLWATNTSNLSITSLSVTDFGNLILTNSSNSVIWSSFNNPTNVIVPNQRFGTNHTLTNGVYSFRIRQNGNLTLTWNGNGNGNIDYFNSRLNSTDELNLTSPSIEIQSIGIVALRDVRLTSALSLVYSSDYAEEGDILRFLRLDGDGNLRIYSSSRGSGVENERWAAVGDQCEVFGYCGNFGVCRYNDTGPVCECPSLNFEFVDGRDGRRGCRRRRELTDCVGNQTMLELDHSVFLTYEPELRDDVFYIGIQPCRLNCLIGSSCVSSTSLNDGSGMCYLKNRGYVSGYRSAAIPSTSFVKVCAPELPNPVVSSGGGRTRWRVTAWLIAVVVIVTVLGLVAIQGGLWWWCFRNGTKFGGLSAQYALLEYASGAPVQFSYKELSKATKGFKEKLGEGGFGAVYKAVLANKTVAAVKQLEGIEQGEKQFRMEVATISSTHHLNLVRLVGFCSEGRRRLLVYEFMKNGSLDSFLFNSGEQSGKHLNWEQRYNIALGTAKGISYLHEECRDCIVHCDIKPENILLDDNCNAKVSDFGLAKLVNAKDHRYRTLTSVRGTRGYLAPEWIANLPVTSRSDIYSYGMVLLEIVSGKRNFEVSNDTNQKRFSIWAYEEFEKGNFEAIVDKRLTRDEMDKEQVMRAIQVSFWCIQEQPSHRPMMSKVVQMLDGITEIDRPPPPKAVTERPVTRNPTSFTTSHISGSSTFAVPSPSTAGISSSVSTTSHIFSVPSPSSAGMSSSVSSRNKEDTDSSSLLRSEIK